MTKVVVNGDLDRALKHLREMVMVDGTLRELKQRRFHIPRSEARKQKSLRARRRTKK